MPVCRPQVVGLCVLVIHHPCGQLATFAYNRAYTLQKPCTDIRVFRGWYGAEHHHVIANVNALMAAMHGACIVLMLGGPLRLRQLAISPWLLPNDSKTSRRGSPSMREQPTSKLLLGAVCKIPHGAWGQQGRLLGINGGNFHCILVARELMEPVLQ
jgi:hypothetical protein